MHEYYQTFDESKRLADGFGDIERERTQDVLARFLPAPPATVLEIGGGTGVYALPLAEAGYQVHLVDPVPHHVRQAEAASAQATRPLTSCTEGDARALSFDDGFADVVLMLGPLYHLVGAGDRITALQEAYRTLRPGGLVFAAAISRFASLIDGVSRGFIAEPAFVSIVRQDLQSGQHRNPTGDPRYFTDAYFHRPKDLNDDLTTAGFTVERILGVEGPFWSSSDIPGWERAERRKLVLELLREVETEPSLLGASAHLVAIGRRRQESQDDEPS